MCAVTEKEEVHRPASSPSGNLMSNPASTPGFVEGASLQGLQNAPGAGPNPVILEHTGQYPVRDPTSLPVVLEHKRSLQTPDYSPTGIEGGASAAQASSQVVPRYPARPGVRASPAGDLIEYEPAETQQELEMPDNKVEVQSVPPSQEASQAGPSAPSRIQREAEGDASSSLGRFVTNNCFELCLQSDYLWPELACIYCP